MARNNVIQFTLIARNQASREIKEVDRNFAALAKRAALVSAAAATAFIAMSREIAKAADEVKVLEGRMKALSGTEANLGRVVRVAKELGSDLKSTGDAFSRFLVAGRSIGATVDDVEKLTQTVFKLGRIGGSSMQEINAAAVQLGQGLASNRLGGEELRSVMEQLPLVGEKIALSLGKSTAELREMGARGELNARVVFKAMKDAADEVNESFADIPFTIQQAENNVKTEWQLLMRGLDEAVRSSLVYSFFIEELGNAISWARQQLNVLTSEAEIVNQLAEVRQQRETNRTNPGGWLPDFLVNQAGVEETDRVLRQRERRLLAQLREFQGAGRRELSAGGGGGGATGAAAAAADGTKALERASQDVDDFIEEEMRKGRERGAEVERFYTEWAQRDVQRAEEAGRAKQQADEAAAREQERLLKEQMVFAEQAARNMQDAFADFLFDPFDDGLKGMLQNFVDVLRRMVAEAAAAQIFSSLGIGSFLTGGLSGIFGGRATGGSVMAGQPVWVGESGRELFVPNSDGRVVPNGAGGGVTLNYQIDARGASTDLVRALPALLDNTRKQAIRDFARLEKNRGGML